MTTLCKLRQVVWFLPFALLSAVEAAPTNTEQLEALSSQYVDKHRPGAQRTGMKDFSARAFLDEIESKQILNHNNILFLMASRQLIITRFLATAIILYI